MGVVTATIEIAAPPQAVWDLTMDPCRFGEWVTIHRKTGAFDDGPLREGFRVEQTLALAGAPFTVSWRLTALDPPLFSRWEGEGPARSYAKTEERLTPITIDGREGTRFDYLNEFKPPGGVIGRMAGKVLVGGISEREAAASLQRLKQVLERGT